MVRRKRLHILQTAERALKAVREERTTQPLCPRKQALARSQLEGAQRHRNSRQSAQTTAFPMRRTAKLTYENAIDHHLNE